MGSRHGKHAGVRGRGFAQVALMERDTEDALFYVDRIGQVRGFSRSESADEVCMAAAEAFGVRGGIALPARFVNGVVHHVPRVEVEFVMPQLMADALGRRTDGGHAVKMIGLAIYTAPRNIHGAAITPNGECTLQMFDHVWVAKLDGTIELIRVRAY